MDLPQDTIVAVATPGGQGGVGIVRLSGTLSRPIIAQLTGRNSFRPRVAHFCSFSGVDREVIDSGLVLCFEEGASFTGESVAEIQAHGSPVALQMIVAACLALGARMARPGEFTERAFLSGNLDLAQAEAVADLISSASQAAVRGAARSLGGEFSTRVNELAQDMLRLRVLLEADIDFPDEEVDVLAGDEVQDAIDRLDGKVAELLVQAEQGVRLARGASIAIIGAPNAGKSSLLNALSGEETAIVTDIPGTTRDVLKVDLVLRGLPIRLIDTAGLREATDAVEEEGVRRALTQIQEADLVVHVRDLTAREEALPARWFDQAVRVLEVWNKSDLVVAPPPQAISAKTGEGLDEFVERLTAAVGYQADASAFTARQRHVQALMDTRQALSGARTLALRKEHSELIAEDVRTAHLYLGEIVGEVTSDALLGEIFSSFCIGK